MIRFKKEEIQKTASKLTSNSELFGDEVASVISQLSALADSANEFGCPIEGTILNCWGGSVSVMAMPDKRRHSWSFQSSSVQITKGRDLVYMQGFFFCFYIPY